MSRIVTVIAFTEPWFLWTSHNFEGLWHYYHKISTFSTSKMYASSTFGAIEQSYVMEVVNSVFLGFFFWLFDHFPFFSLFRTTQAKTNHMCFWLSENTSLGFEQGNAGSVPVCLHFVFTHSVNWQWVLFLRVM